MLFRSVSGGAGESGLEDRGDCDGGFDGLTLVWDRGTGEGLFSPGADVQANGTRCSGSLGWHEAPSELGGIHAEHASCVDFVA